MNNGEIQYALSGELSQIRFDQIHEPSESLQLKRFDSTTISISALDNQSISGHPYVREEFNVSPELEALQLELWELRQAEVYNKDKGLKKSYYNKIKKMKVGKVKKCCSICFLDFEKDEKIRKLPCDHIYHEGCIKNWLSINTNCPLCRLNLDEFFTKEDQQNNLKH